MISDQKILTEDLILTWFTRSYVAFSKIELNQL